MTNSDVPVTLSIDAALQKAIAHHQAGRLREAEQLYRAILQKLPRHADANHNLGVLAWQAGQNEAAVSHFRCAAEVNPSQGQYVHSYAHGLLATGQTSDALRIIEQAMQAGVQHPGLSVLQARAASAAPQVVLPPLASALRDVPLSRAHSNKLIALFKENKFQQVERQAQDLLKANPHAGVAWKLLGLAQQALGKDALPNFQRAVQYLPNDADNHCNLASAMKDRGQLDAAVDSYRQAIAIKPDLVAAHFNLGNVLVALERRDDAIASFRQAIDIEAGFADAHFALATALLVQQQYGAAADSYRHFLTLRPSSAEAHCRLGIALKELDQTGEAVSALRRAVALAPTFAQAHCILGDALCDSRDMRQARTAFEQAMMKNAGNYESIAAVNLAILDYIEGDHDQCRAMLDAARPLLLTASLQYKAYRIYWHYLEKLLSDQQARQWSNAQPPGRPALQVIGESHALSTCGLTVPYDGAERACLVEWIPGCTQWHLGNDQPNKYKRQFEIIMAKMQAQSTVLLQIGEIDCRRDGGILMAWGKRPNSTLAQLTYATVDGYIDFVTAIARRYGHRLIIGGVPAINISLQGVAATESEQLVDLVRIFNARLKASAVAAGAAFLDVHALTDRGDGVASGEWHIDHYHLRPRALKQAFSTHLLAQAYPAA